MMKKTRHHVMAKISKMIITYFVLFRFMLFMHSDRRFMKVQRQGQADQWGMTA